MVTTDQSQTLSSGPKTLSLDSVATLRDLPPSQVTERLLKLSRCVAQGVSDEPVVEAMVELVSREPHAETREAWLCYIAASTSGAFFPILETWIQDSDDERRAQVVGVIAWNRSPKTNEALLRLIQNDSCRRVRSLSLKHLVRRGTLGKGDPCDLTAFVRDSEWRPVTKREYLKLIEHPE
jgi:hypothetical protein